jgi:hypothetical protein
MGEVRGVGILRRSEYVTVLTKGEKKYVLGLEGE